MNTQLSTREALFEVMEQIAAEREAAKPIVEELAARGAEEVWDGEIPPSWRTAGFVLELAMAAFREQLGNQSLTLAQLALAVASSIPHATYPSSLHTYLEGNAWKEIGTAQWFQNRYDAALRAYEMAELRFANEHALHHDESIAQLGRGFVLAHLQRDKEAFNLLEQIAPEFVAIGDQRHAFQCDFLRAWIHYLGGDFQTARAIWQDILSTAEEMNDLESVAILHNNIGGACAELDEASDAVTSLQRARTIYLELGWPTDKPDWGLALVLLKAGEFTRALPLLRRLRDVFLERQMPEDAGLVALEIAEVLIATDQADEARAMVEQALAEFSNANLNTRAVTALAYLRDLLRTTQQPQRAIQHVRSYVEKLRSEPARLFLPLDEKE